ncbi:MAG: conjugal transfer protein TraX [Oscillospiraceae bacterium]|nr:conjugal transfer protein TraX [Oscillospiraceae bacterium]MDE7170796.1 conjugal transfer protein TraX [Oscillospiraceae bacterium]
MENIREKIARRFLKVPEQWLKYGAALIMVLASANTVILKNAVIRLDTYTQESLMAAMDTDSQLMAWVGLAGVMDALAGLAVPLFAFLLVEGFLHTSDFRRYLIRVAATAVVGEFAYDFAMSGRMLDFSRQSPVLGLALCLVMLYFMRRAEKLQMVDRVILQMLLTLCGLFWMLLLRPEYGVSMALLAAIFYCFRSKRIIRLIPALICCLQYPLAPMAFIALVFYNGKRKMKVPGIVFYILYPLHLIVLAVLAR